MEIAGGSALPRSGGMAAASVLDASSLVSARALPHRFN